MDLEGNKFKFNTLPHYLLIDTTSIILTPFNIGLICINIRLTYNTMSHVLVLRKGNYSTDKKLDIHDVWFLENQVPNFLANAVVHHMLVSNGKNSTLPYLKLITKILNYCDYDFGEEEHVHAHTKI